MGGNGHPVNDQFLQFGAIGAIALMALGAVRVLFQREIQAHQQDSDRADRLEAELRKLNETVQTQYLTTMAAATLALAQAVDVLKGRDPR